MASEPERQAIRKALQPIPQPIIVELGAETGQDTFTFEEVLGRPFRHIMVEPDPRNAQFILDHAGQAAHGRPPRPLGLMRRLLLGAVSDRFGFAPFHFSENSENGNHASGSLLEPTGHLQAFPEISFPHIGMVQTWTLDELFELERLDHIDLLWTDLQGSEAAMVRGGETALSHTRYLFLEVEGVELYKGEDLRDDLIAMLPGWELSGDFGCNVLMHNLHFKASV